MNEGANRSITVNHHSNVSALDSRGVQDVLREQSTFLAGLVMREARRSGAF